MKIYLKALGYITIVLLSLTLLLTLFHYFNIIGDKITFIIKVIISILAVAMGGFIVGISCEKKGWLAGLKLSLIIIVIALFLALIFRLDITLKTGFYYLIIIASSTLGSMIGISLKPKKE